MDNKFELLYCSYYWKLDEINHKDLHLNLTIIGEVSFLLRQRI